MDPERPRAPSFVIKGLTGAGRPFRPSDWAERLCGVMASFRPGAPAVGRGPILGYSPYVQPVTVDGVKSVRVDARLELAAPMAYRFCLNFARDNDLQVVELEG